MILEVGGSSVIVYAGNPIFFIVWMPKETVSMSFIEEVRSNYSQATLVDVSYKIVMADVNNWW